MSAESKSGTETPQVSFRFKDGVLDEIRSFAERMGLSLNDQVVRFPRLVDQNEADQHGLFESRDFLIVDVSKIKKLSTADKFAERDRFSRQLLKRFGFMEGDATISQQMEGVDGNKVIELGHGQLPYKAETLVHNMGHRQYLISGFVISPK
jgi:hypothetical protein